jgi:hypothetical protein
MRAPEFKDLRFGLQTVALEARRYSKKRFTKERRIGMRVSRQKIETRTFNHAMLQSPTRDSI